MEAIVNEARARNDLDRLKRKTEFAWYFAERPDSDESDAFFLAAFWDLDTCRAIGFGLGHIPWTAIDAYGLRHGLEPDVLNAFHQIIKALDARYLKWCADEMPKPPGKG